MPKHIAFLRAINVGGHTVKMDRLRGLFEAMGFASVETFIASGNVIFDSPQTDTAALERLIEGELQAALGYPVATFIRAPEELAVIAEKWPFSNADREMPHTLYIGFLSAAPSREAQEKLQACATDVDAFHVDGREVYWLRRDAVGESVFSGAALERVMGAATVRNGRTVGRIAGMIAH